MPPNHYAPRHPPAQAERGKLVIQLHLIHLGVKLKGQTRKHRAKHKRAAPAITFAGAAASAFSFSFPAAMPPCMRQESITSFPTAPASLPAFSRRRSNPAIFNYFEGVALAPHGLGASLRSDEFSTSQQLRPSVTVYTVSNMRHGVKTFKIPIISML